MYSQLHSHLKNSSKVDCAAVPAILHITPTLGEASGMVDHGKGEIIGHHLTAMFKANWEIYSEKAGGILH